VKIRNQEYVDAFGRHVRALRMERKLSQDDLAAIAGIEKKSLARIENGEVNTTISTAYALATALGIGHKEIFNFEFLEANN
jgi:DNA-binding XRE family transcriptional regulator